MEEGSWESRRGKYSMQVYNVYWLINNCLIKECDSVKGSKINVPQPQWKERGGKEEERKD